ncbi:MAG: hypothetical protein P1U68_03050 [Verrucomicrobiales bacterium]|nr:hypothetical protein [Verrucomicrobiales bacterium]
MSSGSHLYLFQSSKLATPQEGAPFHRLFDSLIELTESREDSRFLYWEDSVDAPSFADLRAPAVPLRSLIGSLRQYSRSKSGEGVGDCLEGDARRLVEEWRKEIGDIPDFLNQLYEDCFLVSQLKEVFERMLEANPKFVCYTCFYSLPAFALSHACRTRGIPCWEMQHGQQGDWHYMYTRWAGRKEELAPFLPSRFWAWDQKSKERMEKWWPSTVMNISVGGNPWLSYCVRDSNEIKGGTDDGKPICLISLQFTELPSFVWETIRKRPDFRWWFRMHPRFLNEMGKFRDECDEKLGSVIEWALQEPTDRSLYDLFHEVDVHLTGWSTTAIEALYFKLPTILIHENGRVAMESYIEKGIFAYADTSEKLSDALSFPVFNETVVSEVVVESEVLMSKFRVLAGG